MAFHGLKPPFKVLARHRSPHFLTDHSPNIVTSDGIISVDVGLTPEYLIGMVVGKRRLLWHGVVREHVDRIPCWVLDRPCGATRARVPLGRAEGPEGCSFRARVSIDSLPFSRPKTVTSTENARIDAPHLKIFRP